MKGGGGTYTPYTRDFLADSAGRARVGGGRRMGGVRSQILKRQWYLDSCLIIPLHALLALHRLSKESTEASVFVSNGSTFFDIRK